MGTTVALRTTLRTVRASWTDRMRRAGLLNTTTRNNHGAVRSILLWVCVACAALSRIVVAASSPAWPMFGQNQYRTSLSSVSVGVLSPPAQRFGLLTGGATTSAILDGNNGVYFASADANIYAFNANTGIQLWNYTTGGAIVATPVFNSVINGICTGGADAYFYCVAASNGTLLWKVSVGYAVNSAPMVSSSGAMYFGVGNIAGDTHVYSVSSAGSLSSYHLPGANVGLAPPIILPSGNILAGCHDPGGACGLFVFTTAMSVSWQFSRPGKFLGLSFGVTTGAVYYGDVNGYLVAVAANGSSGSLLWTSLVGSTSLNIQSSPAIDVSGYLYFGCGPSLYSFTSAGASRWSYAVTGTIVSSPSIDANSNLYVGTLSGYLYSVTTSGVLNWMYPIAATSISASVAINGDGTLWVGSDNSTMLAFAAVTPSPTPSTSQSVSFSQSPSPSVTSSETLSITVTLSPSQGFTTSASITPSPSPSASPSVSPSIVPWPMFGQNQYRSSVSRFVGIVSSSPILRFAIATGGATTSVVIGLGNIVYFSSADANIYAYNGSSGTKLWSYTTGGAITATPVINPVINGICTGGADDYFYCLAASNGSLLWKVSVSSGGATLPSPVVSSSGAMFVGVGLRNLYSITSTGSVSSYVVPPASTGMAPPIILPNGYIAIGDHDSGGACGLFIVSTSMSLYWQLNRAGKVQGMSFGVGTGAVYYGDINGYLVAMAANGSSGSLLWTSLVGSTAVYIQSAPAIDASGNLYFGCGPAMYSYTSAGSSRWTYAVTGTIVSSPSIDAVSNLYVGTQSGYVYSLTTSGVLNWVYRSSASSISASVGISADGSLWIGSDNATVFCLHDSPSPSGSPTSSVTSSSSSSPTGSDSTSGTVSPSATRSLTPSTSTTGTSSPTVTLSASLTYTSSMSITVSSTVSQTVSLSISGSTSFTISVTMSTSSSISASVTSTTTLTGSVSPTVSVTVSPTITSSATSTATASFSNTQSISTTSGITVTSSTSISATISFTATMSISSSTSATVSQSSSITNSLSPSITCTQSASSSSSPSSSLSNSVSPSGSLTASASASRSSTASVSVSVSASSSSSSTGSSTDSLSSSLTSSASSSGSGSSTITGTVSASLSATVTLSSSASVTRLPSESPSVTPSSSVTPSFGSSASVTPSVSSSTSLSDSVTATDSETASISSSTTRTSTGSASRSGSPSASACVTASSTPSVSLTATITSSMTLTPAQPSLLPISPSRTSTESVTSHVSVSASESNTAASSVSLSSSGSPPSSVTVTRTLMPSSGGTNVDCVVSTVWSEWSPCIGNSSCVATGLSARILPILTFPSGSGLPCPPASQLQMVQSCAINVSTSCTPCSDWDCGVGSLCGLCNQGQLCVSDQDCAAGLLCGASLTCLSSSVAAWTVYNSFWMVLAGVSAIELGNQSISAVLIDSMLQQISRWGIPGTSNLTATIQFVQNVDLPSVCTLQVAAVPAGLNVTSGVNVTVLVNSFNVYIAVALSEALLVPSNSESLSLGVQQSLSRVLPDLCSLLITNAPSSIETSNSQPLLPPNGPGNGSGGSRASGVPLLYLIAAGVGGIVLTAVIAFILHKRRLATLQAGIMMVGPRKLSSSAIGSHPVGRDGRSTVSPRSSNATASLEMTGLPNSITAANPLLIVGAKATVASLAMYSSSPSRSSTSPGGKPVPGVAVARKLRQSNRSSPGTDPMIAENEGNSQQRSVFGPSKAARHAGTKGIGASEVNVT